MIGDISRGEKAFKQVSQGVKFKEKVAQIRETFGIDLNKFSYSKYGPLLRDQEKTERFLEEVDKLLRSNELPLNSWWRIKLREFILSKGVVDTSYDAEVIRGLKMPFVELINDSVTRDGSFKDIRIYEGVSQKDIKDFISKNWKYVEPSYREDTSKKFKSQKEQDININEDIIELMKLSIEELGGIGKTTKAIQIAKLLSKKYGIRLTDDSVKMRYSRTVKKKR